MGGPHILPEYVNVMFWCVRINFCSFFFFRIYFFTSLRFLVDALKSCRAMRAHKHWHCTQLNVDSGLWAPFTIFIAVYICSGGGGGMVLLKSHISVSFKFIVGQIKYELIMIIYAFKPKPAEAFRHSFFFPLFSFQLMACVCGCGCGVYLSHCSLPDAHWNVRMYVFNGRLCLFKWKRRY